MGNLLLERLQKKDKKGYFKRTHTSIMYQTGFLPLDYRNGYIVKSIDLKENLIGEYASLGFTGGSFITVVGKTGVAKTTFMVQAAFNMVRGHQNGFVIHYDLEQALTYTRIKNITGGTQVELDQKYILKQEKNYIEDIFDSIMDIAREKDSDKASYQYDTGLLDEFGDKIIAYVPTVIIVDSIPTLASKDTKDEMEGGTAASRKAKAIAQFYQRLMPIIKTYNITVMAINHINAKIDISAFKKTQPQVMYLKMDEAVPGGNAPMYYAHNLFKFVSSDKYKMEDDGFDGFKVKIEFLKSRTNKGGQTCELIYNQDTGYDPMLSLFVFADDKGLVEGRNPKRYIAGHKDDKFDSRKFREEIEDNPNIKIALLDVCVERFNKFLKSGKEDKSEIKDPTSADAIMDYHDNVFTKLFDDENEQE